MRCDQGFPGQTRMNAQPVMTMIFLQWGHFPKIIFRNCNTRLNMAESKE